LIPEFATPATLGAHYGALSTAGGVAVLAKFIVGQSTGSALTPSADAAIPWLQLAAFLFCSAIALFFICRPILARVKSE
jgi:hypothetical protein